MDGLFTPSHAWSSISHDDSWMHGIYSVTEAFYPSPVGKIQHTLHQLGLGLHHQIEVTGHHEQIPRSPQRQKISRARCRSCCSSRRLPEGCYRKQRDKIAFENPIRLARKTICFSKSMQMHES